MYITESTTDEKEAERLLTRLLAQVDEDRHARTKGTLRIALDDWLRMLEIEDSTRDTYKMYARRYLYPTFGAQPISKISARVLEEFYSELRRCRARCDDKPYIEHRDDGPHECTTVKHRRPPGRPPVAGYPKHDCATTGCAIKECAPHVCRPLGAATILKLHFMLSGTFAAAMRWDWIKSNPAELARKPRQPAPDPNPPSPDEVSRIVAAAWEQDENWGTLVWLVMVTGVRRGELLRIRWRDVDWAKGTLAVHKSKTHKPRRISLDAATNDLLAELYERYVALMHALDLLQADAAQQLADVGTGPVVREVVNSDVGTWTVMNQVLPGTSAIRSASIDELAAVLDSLASVSRTTKFPPISTWLRERLLNGDDIDLPPGVLAASREERELVMPILSALITNESHSMCHGDLSSGNVLNGPHGLQLIDPRAVSGDIEYDIAVLALKSGHQVSDIAWRVRADVARAEAWASVAIAARV